MIIERVEALAFGPLHGEVLDLAPGMNVVFGPNEAAKSTLHAALYAALCGLRRGHGRPRLEDEAFERAHRPWQGDMWKVRAVIRLADGRRVEVEQDLASPGQSKARDIATGRDLTSEIVNDGSPDASCWLGLTRRSFLSTACVRQAQLLAVADDPGSLQQELQRAAATAGRDETAAAAITRLRTFRSEHVGLDRSNTRKPLRLARVGIGHRRGELAQAQSAHREVLRLLQEAEAAELVAHERDRAVRTIDAALAEQRALAAEHTFARVTELADRYPTEPAPLAHGQDLADRVAGALARWESARAEPDLTGPTSDELRAQLAALPQPPQGDTEIHRSVRDARDHLSVVGAQLEALGNPPAEHQRDQVAADDDELRRLRDVLDADVPALDPALEERHAVAQARHERASRGASRRAVAAGALVLVAAIPLLFLNLVLGVAALIAGTALLAWAIAAARGGAEKLAALEELRAADEELGRQRYEIDAARQHRAGAVQRCADLGVAADVGTIEQLLDDRVAAAAAAERCVRWREDRDGLVSVAADAEVALRAALAARRAAGEGDGGAVFAAYDSACRQRAELAAQAARRPELEASLAAAEAGEKAARAHVEAAAELLALAVEVDRPTTGAASAEDALRAWQVDRDAELAAHQAALQEWRELQTLLRGRTVGELAEEAATLRARADRLTADVDRAEVAAALAVADLETELHTHRTDAAAARATAVKKRTEANGAAASAPSVPEAEEALAAAELELRRIESLDETLETALDYLERAQERVHRDIAPVLAGTVARWLPDVTVGRYRDVTVDPQTLEVRVRGGGGDWREASLLSHGTREQVYLLLRLALSEHLVAGDEQTPLLFDEVTAHCDATRRMAVLTLLHEVSAERQVIVFSHEEPVRLWAEQALLPERDALFVREPVAVA